MPVTKEQVQEWLAHPCTREMIEELDRDTEIAAGYCLGHVEEGNLSKAAAFAGRARYARGFAEKLRAAAAQIATEVDHGSD